MPIFHYFAKSLKGEEKTGIAQAKDKKELSQILKEQGFILIRAAEKEEAIKKSESGSLLSFGSKVSLSEKLIFTRNLQVMVSSDLALPKALETLALQTKNKKFKETILDVSEEIIKGNNFSDALAKHPQIFSGLYQNMVKVGEEAGNLDEVLKILALQLEKENELKSKIKSAMMYPSVIIAAMIGIGVLMLIMVVPSLAKTFEELEIELPLTTQIVVGLGTFLATNWLFALLAVILLVFLLSFTPKLKPGKRIMDALFLKIPVVSALVIKTNSAQTIRTLGSLIAAGVPIIRSLKVTSDVLGNIYYKEALLQATERVKKGEKLSDSLKPYDKIFPLVVIQMIKVGEETGKTAPILTKLADFFEEEIDYATKNMVSVIEPVLMIVIGAAIGFFAISMIQPMYSMLGAI
ncbi:MAG: type II secretion system F family protein [Candidatus Nealsonbacteria bacterium]|nr:type II secretion system F family protein [Candidatus Nealsonbacteria bacterium]